MVAPSDGGGGEGERGARLTLPPLRIWLENQDSTLLMTNGGELQNIGGLSRLCSSPLITEFSTQPRFCSVYYFAISHAHHSDFEIVLSFKIDSKL